MGVYILVLGAVHTGHWAVVLPLSYIPSFRFFILNDSFTVTTEDEEIHCVLLSSLLDETENEGEPVLQCRQHRFRESHMPPSPSLFLGRILTLLASSTP